jgi:hypothetical protein
MCSPNWNALRSYLKESINCPSLLSKKIDLKKKIYKIKFIFETIFLNKISKKSILTKSMIDKKEKDCTIL